MRTMSSFAALLAIVTFLACVRSAGADVVRVLYPVPTVTIYAGDAIAPDLLVDKRFRLSRRAVGSYLRGRGDIVGKVARRTLVAGRPIPRNALKMSEVIYEGARVTLVFGAQGFTIKGAGKAIEGGSVGDTIGVQNIDNGQLVRGVVQEDGTVDVGGN